MKENANKGFTLVELMVALAIGAIVTTACTVLLVQGINQFTVQTVSARIQEDAEVAMNNICDSIQEASAFTILTASTSDSSFRSFSTGSGKPTYSLDGNTIKLDGSPLCKNVKDFKVQLLSSDFTVDPLTNTVKVNNPVRVKVSMKLELQNQVREVTRTVAIRNRLSTVSVNQPINKDEYDRDRTMKLIVDEVDDDALPAFGESPTAPAPAPSVPST